MEKKREEDIQSLTSDERKAISLLKKSLQEKFGLVKLILFGSKARGDHTPDSDVDLLALVKEPKTQELRSAVSETQFEILLQVDAPIMCKVENYDDWVNGKGEVWLPLRDNVEREGLEIEL